MTSCLPSVNMERNWCRTTGRTPAVRTTCAVSVLPAQQQPLRRLPLPKHSLSGNSTRAAAKALFLNIFLCVCVRLRVCVCVCVTECGPDLCESDVPSCRDDQTLIAARAEGSCCLAHICSRFPKDTHFCRSSLSPSLFYGVASPQCAPRVQRCRPSACRGRF